jgi:hypothetical protein
LWRGWSVVAGTRVSLTKSNFTEHAGGFAYVGVPHFSHAVITSPTKSISTTFCTQPSPRVFGWEGSTSASHRSALRRAPPLTHRIRSGATKWARRTLCSTTTCGLP